MGGCAVDSYFPAFPFSRNHVGFDSFPVGDVNHLHLFIRIQSGRFDQFGVNRDASYIVEVRFSDLDSVDFGFQQLYGHRYFI